MKWEEIALLSSWVLFTGITIYRLSKREHSSLIPREGWSWGQLMAIYSLCQTVNFVLNNTSWVRNLLRDQSTTSFLQVLSLVLSRALFYLLLQLSGRQWNKTGLRRGLTRVEWRTILGLTLFATLCDLIFQGAMPLGIVQSCLLTVTAWRTLQQLRQIHWFMAKLPRETHEKRQQYKRHMVYHWCCLVWEMLVGGALIGATLCGMLFKDWKSWNWTFNLLTNTVYLSYALFLLIFNTYGHLD